jgi:hypothetical membrane protein
MQTREDEPLYGGKMRKTTSHRLFAWAGIIGPVIFVSLFLIEGWLRPGYDPFNTYISALALGPRGWIQIVNFIMFGMMLLVFSWGVSRAFKSSRAGIILLMIIALFFLLSGPFVMDPIGTPQSQASVHGTIHGIMGGFVFLLMPISILLFLRSFRVEQKWKSLWLWTFILGIFDAMAVLFFTFASKLPSLQILFNDWIGLIQRVALIPYMIWVFIFALGILSHDKKS